MATALGDSIQRIRTYRRLIKEYPQSKDVDIYCNIINMEWDKIRHIYRSDKKHTVYTVTGLHENPTIYWDLSDLTFAIDDIMSDLIGLTISIEIGEMCGTEIGQLQLSED